MKDHIIAAVVNDLRDTAIKFYDTQQLRERLRHCIEPLLSAAAPQVVADELAVLNEIADLFSIGAEARKEPGIILANVRNTVKFANLLHAVEREFFMSPDDENECLVNCWGSTEEQYLDSMRAALQAAPVQAQELSDATIINAANKYGISPHAAMPFVRELIGAQSTTQEIRAVANPVEFDGIKTDAVQAQEPVPEAAQQNGGLVRAALIDLMAMERHACAGSLNFEAQSDCRVRFSRARHALTQSAFDAPVQPVAAPDEKYGRLTGDNEAQPTQVKGDSQ